MKFKFDLFIACKFDIKFKNFSSAKFGVALLDLYYFFCLWFLTTTLKFITKDLLEH